MDRDDPKITFIILLVIAIILSNVAFLASLISKIEKIDTLHDEAIKRGYAEFVSEKGTPVFKWKEMAEKTK